MLFAGAELAHFVNDGTEQSLGRKGAMAAERLDKAVFAELVAGGIEGFGDAVRVEGETIPG